MGRRRLHRRQQQRKRHSLGLCWGHASQPAGGLLGRHGTTDKQDWGSAAPPWRDARRNAATRRDRPAGRRRAEHGREVLASRCVCVRRRKSIAGPGGGGGWRGGLATTPRWADKQAGRQTDRQTDRRAGRQARQAGRQTPGVGTHCDDAREEGGGLVVQVSMFYFPGPSRSPQPDRLTARPPGPRRRKATIILMS